MYAPETNRERWHRAAGLLKIAAIGLGLALLLAPHMETLRRAGSSALSATSRLSLAAPLGALVFVPIVLIGIVSLSITFLYFCAPRAYMRFVVWSFPRLRKAPSLLLLFGTTGIEYRRVLRLFPTYIRGDAFAASKISDGMDGRTWSGNWNILNLRICVLIAAGRYLDAVRLFRTYEAPNWDATSQEPVSSEVSAFLLARINLAEAFYNLGRFGCATRVLDLVAPSRDLLGCELVRSGLLLQRSWLALLTGQPQLALEFVDRVGVQEFPELFQAEWHFAKAATLRDLKRFDEALATLSNSSKLLKRSSSRRNALFLGASVLAARGDRALAIQLLEKGAAHRFRGQGGDGLLLLGDLYRQEQRPDDAARAYALAAARDPESRSARLARQRGRNTPRVLPRPTPAE
jgi:tetratricopeptide (TPR) repeat protein